MNQYSENINAFPTPIRVIKNFLSVNECVDLETNSSSLNFHDHPSFKGKVISTHDTHYDVFHCFANSNEVLVRLDKEMYEYSRLFGISEVKLTNSWINKQFENTKLLPHTHPMSVISGALYIKADQKSSRILFQNPNPFLSIMALKGLTNYNLGQISIPPTTGTLILFPSWLTHSSGEEANLSQERIVISFNTCYKNGV
jgi:uncharacterized protein (TIGR02466 family)